MFPPLGFLLAAAFVLGVALEGSEFFVPVFVFLLGSILTLWVWQGHAEIIRLGVVVLLVVLIGSLRVGIDDGRSSAPSILSSGNRFSGEVLDVPRHYPTASYTRLEITEPAPATTWAVLPPYPEVAQGDVIELNGAFTPTEGRSSRGFAAQRGTAGELTAETVRVTGSNASTAQRWRASIAGEIRDRLRQRIPEPAGAFATGAILGDDGAMTEATRDAFRVSGMTHMTAVSGIHVGILAGAILLLSRVGLVHRWWLLGSAIPLIWSFAYLVGMRPSVVRASLMLTLLLVAQLLGRPRDTLNAVGIATALMILADPAIRFDVGFQLSVAATTGIALVVLLIGDRSHWHLIWAVPVAAQIATEPLILYHFGYYSLVSPLANIVAAPFLAVTMAMSFLTVLGSLLSGMLGDALALGTWVPAYAVVTIAHTAAGIPYLSEDVPPLSFRAVWVSYALLIGAVALLYVVLRPGERDEDADVALLYRV